MNAPLFAGIGGHHSAKAIKEDWLTPQPVIIKLGGWESFALDPCAPDEQPYPTARRKFTVSDNGLIRDWGDGRVFLNPPYTPHKIRKWMARMAEHGHGTALIFARTETRTFFKYVWESATAVRFLRGRLNFNELPDGLPALRRNGTPQNAGGPSVLCAYGFDDADILSRCGIPGHFIPLIIPRSVLVRALDLTWAAALAAFFEGRHGPVHLAEIYEAFAAHSKARSNQNYQAKLRQQLQRGPYINVGRGRWDKQQ